jgi:hypothetical protein
MMFIFSKSLHFLTNEKVVRSVKCKISRGEYRSLNLHVSAGGKRFAYDEEFETQVLQVLTHW